MARHGSGSSSDGDLGGAVGGGLVVLAIIAIYILVRQYRETLLHHVSDPLVVQFFKSKFGEKVNSQLVDSTLRDGYVQFVYQGKEQIGICFEIDRNTENKEKIQDKIRNYLAFASGIYQQAFACQSLTIAFVVTEGGDLRVKTLKNWAHEILQDKQEYAALFLFAAVNLDTLTPNELFFSPSWSSISAPSRTSLIEI